MFSITFNPQMDLGHIVALVALAPVLIGLILQARSLSIAKKELNIKVKDLNEVVARIEREAREREKLANKHRDLVVSQLKSSADETNYTTYVLRHVQFVNHMEDQLIRDRLITLSAAINALTRIIAQCIESSKTDLVAAIIDVTNTLFDLVSVEVDHEEERKQHNDKWEEEQKDLLDKFEVSKSWALKQKIEQRIQELGRLQDKLNAQYESKLREPQKRYKDATLRFSLLLKEVVNGETS
jgi:NhaP-type Na+/H+ and K+/H+ antiporter